VAVLTTGAAVGACAGSTGPGVALAASLALAVVATLAVNAAAATSLALGTGHDGSSGSILRSRAVLE